MTTINHTSPEARLRGNFVKDGIRLPYPAQLAVLAIEGKLYRVLHTTDATHSSGYELCINADGELGRLGTAPGEGFLPDTGELARLGVTPTAQTVQPDEVSFALEA